MQIVDLLLPLMLPDEGTQMEPLEIETRWAREWLIEVSEARKALERYETINQTRSERAYALPNPLAHVGEGRGKGGVVDHMKAVDEMVDAEADDTSLDWARDALTLFCAMAAYNRKCLRGALLNGLDVAEMRYRLGMSDRKICKAFGISRTKLYNDLNAFVDYMDYIGPDSAFKGILGDPDEASDNGQPDDAHEVEAGPHSDVYAQLHKMASGTHQSA